MPFIIDENTLLIRGRKGDSATFNFKFNQDLTGYTLHFFIKKNINDSDEKIVIKKDYLDLNGNSITVNLTPEETGKLLDLPNSYTVYYWGLKLSSGKDYALTIIPKDFSNPPMMYIYPQVGGIDG